VVRGLRKAQPQRLVEIKAGRLVEDGGGYLAVA